VQQLAIPLLLEGRDVVAQAPTGTGKTAAYGLPMVERLKERDLHTQALVVVPTRELAIQVAEALNRLGRRRQMVTLPVYGGQPYERQLRALALGVQVVVGTPGRLLDHVNRKTLKLDTVRFVVLDEADEMLDMGFVEDIEKILAELPPGHQTAFFSATIPARVRRLGKTYLENPEYLTVDGREAVAPRVRQVYYEVPYSGKMDALARILDLEGPESAIVFVRTRRDADDVAQQLSGSGYIVEAIHGDMNQVQRERVLARFRAGHIQVLVGTDVAGRGLDIPDVSHVINYDLPADAESYVHRIGRTGRAGRTGEAVTLVTPRERRLLVMIERGIHRRLQPLRLPTPADIADRRRAAFREEVLKVVDAGELDQFIALVEDLASSRDVTELAAAAFKMATERHATPERPGVRTPPDRTPRTDAGPRRTPPPERNLPRRATAGLPRRGSNEPMTRVFLRVGKVQGVRPADLVGAIANEAGIPGDAIGDIDLFDGFSVVEVPASVATQVEAALNRTSIRGHHPGASLTPTPSQKGDSIRPPRPGRQRPNRRPR
jgi:ATP-dependent RNA helicase DeaD